MKVSTYMTEFHYEVRACRRERCGSVQWNASAVSFPTRDIIERRLDRSP